MGNRSQRRCQYISPRRGNVAKIMGYFRNFTKNVSAPFSAICSDMSRFISLAQRCEAQHIATYRSLSLATRSAAAVETGLKTEICPSQASCSQCLCRTVCHNTVQTTSDISSRCGSIRQQFTWRQKVM